MVLLGLATEILVSCEFNVLGIVLKIYFFAGGGLTVEVDGIWYLRGIVSSALLADGVCDTHNYAVFTDVQKFSSWLQTYVQS